VDPVTVNMYKKLKITANKQSAARSATEQAADLSPIFKILHNLQKTTTSKDVKSGDCPYKDRILYIFSLARQQGLDLVPNKRNALVDFLSNLPENVSKTCTPTNIRAGFYENGMVSTGNPRKYAFPCFLGNLATYRKKISSELKKMHAGLPNHGLFCV
jgi:hypothetical protein